MFKQNRVNGTRTPRSSHRTAARSPRPKRRLGQCEATGKVRFRDKREAQAALHSAVAARQLREAEGRICRRQEQRMYECASCNGWHLTSQTAEFREARVSRYAA